MSIEDKKFEDKKIQNLKYLIANLATRPALQGEDLQAYFDGNAEQIKDAFNNLINALNENNEEISESIATKADATETKTELATKADKTTVENSLATKANKTDVENALANKVDKVDGKDLSDNNFSDADKDKLEELKNYDDSALKNDVSNLKAKDEQLFEAMENKVNKQTGKGLSSNDYTDFEKTKIRLIDYRNIDTFIEDGFYIVYEDGPGMYDKYWTLYPLIQTSMFTGEEIEYTQVKYTAYGIAKRMSYGTADNYGAWERNDIVDVRDSLTSSEKNAALSANMGKVLNETKADADKWERIANASLTEDVTSLIIQNEPDGTPYNFKKMKVFITMPSGGNGNAYFQIKNGSNSSVAYFLLTHTKAYCEMYIEGGYAFAKTRSNTGEYSQFTNASSGVPMDCFNKVHIGANGTILAGTKFEIWGVRNK